MKKIRNEFGKVVGRYLYEGRFFSLIYDVPDKSTYLTQEVGDKVLSKKQTRRLKKELKAIIKVWE